MTPPPHHDGWNYALLILLYTLQGVPMGLSASIPFLLQDRLSSSGVATTATAIAASHKATYQANAIFALCSWPFSLKLLWAPIVDALSLPGWGRRKSWLIPVQTMAGCLLYGGANFVHNELTLGGTSAAALNVPGLTVFFGGLYFLMATQDIAVDGWALTMLQPHNRGKGPICNSIGQNLGSFVSFVGLLALLDVEASERYWRPLLGWPSDPTRGVMQVGGFLQCMGILMLITTLLVALFKREVVVGVSRRENDDTNYNHNKTTTTTMSSEIPVTLSNSADTIQQDDDDDEEAELDARQIGLKETYHRLWAVCQLPAVRKLFWILVTYRLPVALSDNVKFLKAVEYGLSKSTTALLSPTLILPLGILVPIVAHRIWPQAPLRQFFSAYQFRVTLVPLLDLYLLHLLKTQPESAWKVGLVLVASTAAQTICQSLQFNAQMTFFASRVDPAIGGSYMTLLNTAANLGGTWPSSVVLWSLGWLSSSTSSGGSDGSGGDDNAYTKLQLILTALGLAWIVYFGPQLQQLASLPGDSWRTHLNDDDDLSKRNATTTTSIDYDMLESGETSIDAWQQQQQQQQQQQEPGNDLQQHNKSI